MNPIHDRTRPSVACNLAVIVVSMLLLSTPIIARVELQSPIEESPPTSEDLNGIAMAPSGEMIAVGDTATVLRRVVDAEFNPVWTSLGAWASGFFNAEILTVVHSPVSFPAGEGWVIGGREAVVETDFTNTTVIDQRIGSGKLFTPVLPTAEEIWYGVPDLGLFPSFLHRYDRATQTAPGIAFPLGPVLAMCQLPGGNLRYVTTDGDIAEINDSLQVTTLWDQDDGDPLGLNAASFSEDCQFISGGDSGPNSRIYAGLVEAIRGPSSVPWRHVDRTGQPAVNSTCNLTPREHQEVVAFFSILLRCNDGPETGDEATMASFAGAVDLYVDGIEDFNLEEKCQRGGVAHHHDPTRRGASRGLRFADIELITVGTGGRVQRIQGSVSLFADGFEDGTFGRWSGVVE